MLINSRFTKVGVCLSVCHKTIISLWAERHRLEESREMWNDDDGDDCDDEGDPFLHRLLTIEDDDNRSTYIDYTW